VQRYEVSNFARAGHRSRHNRAYWRNEPFWAYGLGATSHLAGRRLARPRSMKGYQSFVEELERDGLAAVHEAHGAVHEVGREALTTRLMLGLRTREGIALPELTRDFGDELGGAAAAACRDAAAELPSGWFELGDDDDDDDTRSAAGDGAVRLSDPEGLLFSNDAIATVFARLDERLDG